MPDDPRAGHVHPERSAGPAADPRGADEPPNRTYSLDEIIAEHEFTQAEIDGAPDEPGDDDLAELRRLHEQHGPYRYNDLDGLGDDGNTDRVAAVSELLDALPGLLAEVERLRAAAPASEDDEATRG